MEVEVLNSTDEVIYEKLQEISENRGVFFTIEPGAGVIELRVDPPESIAEQEGWTWYDVRDMLVQYTNFTLDVIQLLDVIILGSEMNGYIQEDELKWT